MTPVIARKTTKLKQQTKNSSALPTFMDHVRELQGRLFSVAIIFLLISGAVYPFFDAIANFLIAPLGQDHELVYLTPGGAFSFIIQVCLYVGLVGSLPFIIYHIYRFLMPAVQQVSLRRVLLFTVSSFALAIIGLLFAYFISLPAALYFLTSFDLYHINPMLTIDAYFSFIMTYMLAGALLFQLPLVMLIIDSIKPLTPKKMMNYQRHILVGSFVVAAIISPTPDALNQTLLASPIVIMYQVGIGLIWLKHRRKARKEKEANLMTEAQLMELSRSREAARPKPLPVAAAVASSTPALPEPPVHSTHQQPGRSTTGSLDGFLVPSTAPRVSPRARGSATPPVRALPQRPSVQPRPSYVRTLDGFLMPTR